jgi:hypothetical protein
MLCHAVLKYISGALFYIYIDHVVYRTWPHFDFFKPRETPKARRPALIGVFFFMPNLAGEDVWVGGGET